MAIWKRHFCSRTVGDKPVQATTLRLTASQAPEAEAKLAEERQRLNSLGFTTDEAIEPTLLVPDWDSSLTLFLYYW